MHCVFILTLPPFSLFPPPPSPTCPPPPPPHTHTHTHTTIVSSAESSVSLASTMPEGGALSTADSLAATTVTASLTQPLVSDKLMWSPSTTASTPKVKGEPQTPTLAAHLSTPTGERRKATPKLMSIYALCMQCKQECRRRIREYLTAQTLSTIFFAAVLSSLCSALNKGCLWGGIVQLDTLFSFLCTLGASVDADISIRSANWIR